MTEGRPSSDDPFNETVATTGLFMIITAIIALAFALASWGQSEALMAAFAGAIAVVSFTASILCFRAQAAESASPRPPAGNTSATSPVSA